MASGQVGDTGGFVVVADDDDFGELAVGKGDFYRHVAAKAAPGAGVSAVGNLGKIDFCLFNEAQDIRPRTERRGARCR